MTTLQAVIQGIVQGATEFLPVSSSGHLSLAQHFMGVEQPGLLFDVMLHLGTLAAVLAVYYRLVIRLFFAFCRMLGKFFTGRFKWRKMDPDENLVMMLMIGLLPLFLLFLPVPGTGARVKDFADLWATDGSILLEGFALIATSILLTLGIIASRQMEARHTVHKHPPAGGVGGRRSFRVMDAVAVGVTQCFAAVFPGLSRSGSTLSVGLVRGLNRQTALDYSFVIGIPSILAAAVLELKDAVSEGASLEIVPIIAGVLTAAVVGFLAIKLLRWMVTSDKLWIFVCYTFLVGIAVVIMGIIEHNTGVNIVTGLPIGG